MIAQLKKGCGFAGLTAYCRKLSEEKSRIIEHKGVCTISPKAMAASLNAQAKMNDRVKLFVGHAMLSFSPKDEPKLTDKFLLKVSHKYMERMGIKNTQYVIYRHYDQPHGHVHIVYNRVDNEGNAIKTDTNFRASAAATIAIKREFGLTFGKDKQNVRRERLKGKDKVKYHLYDTISEALRHVHAWYELREWLKNKGVDMRVEDKNGRKGVSFSDGKYSFAGSKIDRTLGYTRIDKIFREYALRSDATVGNSRSHTSEEKSIEKEDMGIPNWARGRSSEQYIRSTHSRATSNGDVGEENSISIKNNVSNGSSEVSSDSGSSIGDGIVDGFVAAASELILQPHVVPTIGGGGGNTDSKKKRDDDDEENEQVPRRKGRRR